MQISLIQKPMAGGKKSLQLCYYYGYTKTSDGKIKHQRKFEKLDLFISTEPKDHTEKHHNKEALRLAELIRAKRELEAAAGQHGFNDVTKLKASFVNFFQQVIEEKHRQTTFANASIYEACFKQFIKYHPEQSVSFEQLRPAFIDGFKTFLLKQAHTKTGSRLSQNTSHAYFSKFCGVIKLALERGIIANNPLLQVKSIKPENNKREYLSIEELRILAKTDCRYDVLKRAFLFSCLTGLRWIDIQKLNWQDVQAFDGSHRLIFTQQKTSGLQYLDISPQAYALLGTPGTGKVFFGLRYSTAHNLELSRWTLAAGITKHITFHCARHTFAVTLLTQGVDIYTVSKLLGHSELKTTQIYADIIDSVRKQAMHKLPDIGL